MSKPTESDLLEALDRRARAASDGLASAVATVPIPEPELEEPRPSRRFAPLVAAAVVLVALVGIVLVRAPDEQGDGTVAGQPSLTHLVLPDPGAVGYELSAAFDGTETSSGDVNPYDIAVSVQGPADGDDPWAAGVLAYSLPGEMTTLDGESVDLGGVDAAYQTDGIAATIGWVDGDEVRYLVSSRRTRDELVDLARTAVAEATPAGAPLPGQRILFAGNVSDVFPTLATSVGAPPGLRGVAYTQLDGDDGLVVATRSGDQARWRAAGVVARSTEQVTVRGRRAMVARFGTDPSLVEVSWLEADGTLVRAGAATTSDTGALVAVLDQLEPIDDEAFAELLRSHPIDPDGRESFSESGAVVTEDGASSSSGGVVPLAAVEMQSGDRSYRASLTGAGGSGLSLDATVETPQGSSGSSVPVTGLDVEAAVRNDQPDGTVAIALLIGPHTGPIEVRDAASGEVVAHESGSEANIEGSDHTVVLLVAVDVRPGQELLLVATAPDGREVSVPV